MTPALVTIAGLVLALLGATLAALFDSLWLLGTSNALALVCVVLYFRDLSRRGRDADA